MPNWNLCLFLLEANSIWFKHGSLLCLFFLIVLLHDPYLVFSALRFWFEGLVADCQLCTAYEGAPCLVCLPLSTDLRFFKAVSAHLARRLAVRAAGQSYCPFMLLKCSLFEQTVSQDVLKPSCAIARKLGRWCARENNWSFWCLTPNEYWVTDASQGLVSKSHDRQQPLMKVLL